MRSIFAAFNLFMRYIFYIFTFLFLTIFGSSAQKSFKDTVSVFAYNINDYGTASTKSCPILGAPARDGYLRSILRNQSAPDIVGFEKFNGTPTNLASDSIQRKIMDSVCKGCYANTTYTNLSGYSKVNTLFYKVAKFGYLGTTTIYSADNSISDINMHKLYYKNPSLATTKDTIYLNVIVVHDASGASSAKTRGTEISGAMTWLSMHVTAPGNYIFMGDFNTQTGSEACIQAMVNPKDTMIKFNDPPNQLGDWAGNPQSFAKYLTQSTRRVDPGDCASTNTMLERFDHIFCTNPIIRGTKNIKYIPGTFTVIGQDGLHTGVAINDAPTNTSVPPDVLNSLYMMSEHLPVQLKLEINIPAPLPIGFNYFKISLQNNHPFLQWQNSNNALANDYEIERSEDGIAFTTVRTNSVTAGSVCSYTFLDATFSSNKQVFYRVKEQLKSGGYLYSNVETIRPVSSISQLVIAPNPVSSRMVLYIKSIAANEATINIINTLGQTCLSQQAQLQDGENSIAIHNLPSLTKGVYVVKVQAKGYVESKLFVKE